LLTHSEKRRENKRKGEAGGEASGHRGYDIDQHAAPVSVRDSRDGEEKPAVFNRNRKGKGIGRPERNISRKQQDRLKADSATRHRGEDLAGIQLGREGGPGPLQRARDEKKKETSSILKTEGGGYRQTEEIDKNRRSRAIFFQNGGVKMR